MFLFIYIIGNPGKMYGSEFQGGWYITLNKAEFINTGILSCDSVFNALASVVRNASNNLLD